MTSCFEEKDAGMAERMLHNNEVYGPLSKDHRAEAFYSFPNIIRLNNPKKVEIDWADSSNVEVRNEYKFQLKMAR
jgi:hypothetical protein